MRLFNEIKWKNKRTFGKNEEADYLWSPPSTKSSESALNLPVAIMHFNRNRPELDCATVAHRAWLFAANTAASIDAPARNGLDSNAGNAAPSAMGPSTAVPPVVSTSRSNVVATSAELATRTSAPRSPREVLVNVSEELVATRFGSAEAIASGDFPRQSEKLTSGGIMHSAPGGGMSPSSQGRST